MDFIIPGEMLLKWRQELEEAKTYEYGDTDKILKSIGREINDILSKRIIE